MQKNDEKKGSRFFLFCLLAVGFAVLVSNLLGKNVADVTSDLILTLLSGALLVLSLVIAAGFRAKGDHGIAYLIFAAFAFLWFVAEAVYFQSEITSHLTSLPQWEDSLYLGGYPLLFIFSLYYLKPFNLAISRKLLAYAAAVTSLFLIPTLYSTYSLDTGATVPEILWAGIYPIADAAILFPAVLGLGLFVKGEVGLFWSFTCIAIILNIVADSGFFFLDLDKSSYSGNPINILYMWSYLLFSFGIYTHVKLFKKTKMNSFGKADDLK